MINPLRIGFDCKWESHGAYKSSATGRKEAGAVRCPVCGRVTATAESAAIERECRDSAQKVK